MKYVDEYRNGALAKGLIEHIHRRSTRPIRLMEFCGGHTVAILRYGIRQVMPPTVEMLSGPGCPVCVTDNADLDKAIALAREPGVIIATFGDMFKVPASRSSLQKVKAEGADVRMVYSPLDALHLARDNPDKAVVFLGVGFETTAPGIAASILQAEQEGIENYYLLSMHKLTPPATKAILDAGEVRLNGIIGPGHVTTVIGARAWEFLPQDYGIPCVIAGFQPLDILQGVAMLVDQLEEGRAEVGIAYRRSVRPEGNQWAMEQMYRVFEICEAPWRGLGVVPQSGLKLRPKYARFDAEQAFDIDPGPTREPKGCRCGEVLRGVAEPLDCPLFGKGCVPERPMGPCMVSAEGACAAYYHYGGVYEG
ncbi:MAG: hydrogenase formation protein HypD [Anaerolineae bacterium]